MEHHKMGCHNRTISEHEIVVVDKDGVTKTKYYQYSCPRCGWQGTFHREKLKDGDVVR